MSGQFDLLNNASVFLFSGIAKNIEFKNMVKEIADAVVGDIQFTDHHCYSESDFQMISIQAKQCGADYLLTTEKDYVKIAGKMSPPIDMIVLGIKVSFMQDEEKFSLFIKDRMAQ